MGEKHNQKMAKARTAMTSIAGDGVVCSMGNSNNPKGLRKGLQSTNRLPQAEVVRTATS